MCFFSEMPGGLTEAGKGIFQNDSLKGQLKGACISGVWEGSNKLMMFSPRYAYK